VHAPRPPGQIRQELDRLGDNDLVRVIDALGVRKGRRRRGRGAAQQPARRRPAGRVRRPSGRPDRLGAAGEEGSELGAERARPARAGGVRLVSESISPLDLVAIGLAEAEALASVDGDAL
jgi:hypothetical protein